MPSDCNFCKDELFLQGIKEQMDT